MSTLIRRERTCAGAWGEPTRLARPIGARWRSRDRNRSAAFSSGGYLSLPVCRRPLMSGVRMCSRHPETVDRIALEVELDQDHRFLADDPAVMTRFDRDDLRRLVFHDAAVGVFDVDLAAREEAD